MRSAPLLLGALLVACEAPPVAVPPATPTAAVPAGASPTRAATPTAAPTPSPAPTPRRGVRTTAAGSIPESFRYVGLDQATGDGVHTRLWLVDLTGGRAPLVVAEWEAPVSPVGGYTASADGRTVLVSAFGSRGRVALHAVRPETGTASVLFEEPGWIPLAAVISPDGQRYAFTRYPDGGGSDDGVHAGAVARGDARRVVAPDAQAVAPPLALGWSVDSVWLAYLRTRERSEVVIATEGGAVLEVGPGDHISWRRNPPQLIVAANGAGREASRIYTYDLGARATNEVATVEGAAYASVEWHPFFDRFIYDQIEGGAAVTGGAVWIRNADGSAATRFDLGQGASRPKWSADGTMVTALVGGDDSVAPLIELFTGRPIAVLCRRGGIPPADCT